MCAFMYLLNLITNFMYVHQRNTAAVVSSGPFGLRTNARVSEPIPEPPLGQRTLNSFSICQSRASFRHGGRVHDRRQGFIETQGSRRHHQKVSHWFSAVHIISVSVWHQKKEKSETSTSTSSSESNQHWHWQQRNQIRTIVSGEAKGTRSSSIITHIY